MITLMVSYVWQVLAERRADAETSLCDQQPRDYIAVVAGSCVPFLPASYFDTHPSPLQGLAAWQPGPFFLSAADRHGLLPTTNKRAVNARALQRT